MTKLFLFLSTIIAVLMFADIKHKDVVTTYPPEAYSFNGIKVYKNNSHIGRRRHLAKDGYNLGLKYQCVEYVKRYYYYHLHHKMPDTYGHAKSFFMKRPNKMVLYNNRRDLMQYANGNLYKPKTNDIIVMGPSSFNRYGHVAIVTTVTDYYIEIIQQNTLFTRERLSLSKKGKYWYIDNKRVLGWLRKE